MPLALRVLIGHARRDHFADVRDFAHGDDFGDVQVLRVTVLFNRNLLGAAVCNFVGHRHAAKTTKCQYQ
ncbi:hypothetical protein D3C73_1596060 [compost metagenome]